MAEQNQLLALYMRTCYVCKNVSIDRKATGKFCLRKRAARFER